MVPLSVIPDVFVNELCEFQRAYRHVIRVIVSFNALRAKTIRHLPPKYSTSNIHDDKPRSHPVNHGQICGGIRLIPVTHRPTVYYYI